MEYTLNCNGRLLDLSTPQVMGILNATPDSFYAGSRVQTEQQVAHRVGQILCEGGSIIDVGACSTRPDSAPATEVEEMERLLKPYIPAPFMVTKVKDEKFGEAVVLLSCNSSAPLKEICQSVLPPFWCPRHFLTVDVLPTTETGKPARRKAEELAMNMLR